MPTTPVSKQNETLKKNVWQVIKFTLFSASAGIIQLGTFEVFSKLFSWDYWLAYGLSLLLSVLWNYTFNRRYTFRSNKNVPKAMALVFLYYVAFAPASIWWGNALTNAGWNEDLVMIGTMLINFVTEFLYQRMVVYKNSIDTNDLVKGE